MILPEGNDRSWTREFWKVMQRMERCTQRVMRHKWEKAWTDNLVYGYGSYEQTKEDMDAISNLMQGKRP